MLKILTPVPANFARGVFGVQTGSEKALERVGTADEGFPGWRVGAEGGGRAVSRGFNKEVPVSTRKSSPEKAKRSHSTLRQKEASFIIYPKQSQITFKSEKKGALVKV